MIKSKSLILTSLAILLGITFLTAAACGQKPNTASQQEAATVATWLTDHGVKMYGAFWCPHCNDQKEIFGEAFKKINYIECSLPDRSAQTQVCKDAKIEAYPTWEFADGSRVESVLTIAELKSRAGYPTTAGPQPEPSS